MNYWHFRQRRSKRFQECDKGGVAIYLLLLVLLIPVLVFFVFPDTISRNVPFFEREPPEIQLVDAPLALGLEPILLQVSVKDAGAGLDEAVVRIRQGSQERDLIKKVYSEERLKQDLFTVEVKAKELGLREGKATLELVTYDRSFWSNAGQNTNEVRILYSKPRVEVLTSMHNVAQGGSGLVFYRHLAGEISESGAQVGSDFFPGYPAALLDSDFQSRPDVYFAFFAVPRNFDDRLGKITVIARDVAGNLAHGSLYFVILKRSFRDVPMPITEGYLRRKVPDLLPGYFELAQIPNQKFDAVQATVPELIQSFRLINEKYRKLLGEKLQEVLAKPSQKKWWSGAFARPISGAPTSSFGENRSYELDGASAGSSVHDGLDLAATANTPVHSAAIGKVIYADDLGIYGNTVIVDHGFGLTTLYGHLSSIGVTVGEELNTTHIIGRSGATGLAGGDHLHFEIRVNGRSVTPIEWWDKKWVADHIEGRIGAIKEQVKQLS